MKDLALLFLKLGTVAFGGPAAHIAMMEEEVVKRRKWISHEQFLDILGATNIIPGPNSTEMAIHIGYVRAGWKGLILAGMCFIIPAVLITLLLAQIYVTYRSTPQLGSLIFGIRSAIIAVIASAVYRLGKPVLKNSLMLVLGVLVAILNLFGFDEILLLLVSGAIGLLWNCVIRMRKNSASLPGLIPVASLPLFASTLSAAEGTGGATLAGLGLFFLKIGSILYGSGYVLVAFLQAGQPGRPARIPFQIGTSITSGR